MQTNVFCTSNLEVKNDFNCITNHSDLGSNDIMLSCDECVHINH